MQSVLEEEVDPFQKAKEEPTQPVKQTKKNRKKSKAHKASATNSLCDEISLDFIEKFIDSFEYNKPPKYHPLYTEVDHTEDVTKIFNIKPNMSKCFVINEDVFLDLDPTIVEEDQLCEYQLYKVMKSETIPEMDGQDDELTEADLKEDLLITEESTKYGVIINNNVFLTTEQWNTIYKLDKDIFSCAVCDLVCDSATVTTHIHSAAHNRKLDAHRPLKRFDLSITRKINDHLHCAVCNTIYLITKYREHENLKSHEETLLTAINKVTDILYDGYNQNTTQSFSNNNIQAPNNTPQQWLNYTDLSTDTNSPRTAAYSPRTGDYSPRTGDYSPRTGDYSLRTGDYSPRTGDYSPRTGDYGPRNETFTPSYANTPRSDFFENRVQSKEFETKNFNFKNTYGDIKIYEEEDIEEYIPPIEGISYASMASKPMVAVPKFLKIDLGTKEVRVKYESWHMITQTEPNQIYCMVCNTSMLLRQKNQHCLTDEHKALLGKCKVVGAFEDYLIRDVNDKLFHCGHCNNLQVKNDILPHIEKYHPTKNKNIKDINPLQLEKPKSLPIMSLPTITTSMDQATRERDIFGDFKFCPFGTEMEVPKLGYHTLMIGNDDKYFCAICNMVVQDDLIKHVFEPAHMQLILMTPFIRPFASHLTRAIRGSLHCLLCNVLVSVRAIYAHNMSEIHTTKLAHAFKMRPHERPTQEVKYQCENPNEYKTDLEGFLSTLPPDSRAALSKLTIKNHKGELVHLSDSNSSISPSSLSADNSPKPSEVSKYQIDEKLVSPISSVNNYTVTNNGGFPPLPTPLHPGQLVTVSMLESGLPGVRTGSPVAAFRPPLQLQITGPMDLKMSHGVGRIPVSPVRRKEDIEVENDLLSLYKQSPVRTKMPEKKPMDTMTEDTEKYLVVNIENKIEKSGKVNVVEKTGAKTDIKTEAKTDIKTAVKTSDKTTHKTADKTADKTDMKTQNGKEKDEKHPPSSISDAKESPFKLDEPVLLKIKTSYFRVSNTAYQTLVHLSNGSRYCFVCSQKLDYSDLQKHVVGNEHIENMAKNKFLCNFNNQLLRQMYLMYHCALCNVTMSRRDIKLHLNWQIHLDRHAAACKKLNKKILKEALREGVKELLVETQKEHVFANIPEPSVNIVTYIQSVKEDFVDRVEERKLVKMSQMIILKETMLKISFESWHGIVTTKSGTKCVLCQTDVSQDELHQHVDSKSHKVALGMPFLKQYYPALARQINDSTINCVICNLELPADESHVAEHISGRKHDKNYSAIVERTSQADTYSDCYKHSIKL